MLKVRERTRRRAQPAQLHGVDRMYYLEPGGPISNAQPNIVYLCSASPKLMRVIAGAWSHGYILRTGHI